jgi:hypothetical protein
MIGELEPTYAMVDWRAGAHLCNGDANPDYGEHEPTCMARCAHDLVASAHWTMFTLSACMPHMLLQVDHPAR